jgi:predicted ATPase
VTTAVRRAPGTNLPAELTSFVGRRRELARARELLSVGRLLTLTGMGGVGKTRLAQRIAIDTRRAFRDGVWQVELADLHDPALLAETVALGLGLREGATRWDTRALAEAVDDQHLLLLLDNCEHVVDGCATLLSGLLGSCPKLHVLATSRQPIGVAGEQTLSLSPLPVPDIGRLPPPEALERFDGVKLFLDRAVGEVPGFTINDRNYRAVAQLCERVDGVPLAIELAAIRLRSLSTEQIVARLDDRFRLLTRGRRAAPARQQTLQALIDWSYELCSPVQRTLWTYLSVFADGFELDAADAVRASTELEGEDVVDLIADLVEKSVLIREEHDDVVRYRMGELIREYGRNRLRASGEEQDVRTRHRAWCVDLTQRAYDAWFGAEQLSWYNRIHREISNIRVAADPELAGQDGLEQVLEILVRLVTYSVAMGGVHRSCQALADILARSREPSIARARGLHAAAYLTVLQRRDTAVIAMLEESASIASALGADADRAWVTAVTGVAELNGGDLRLAFDLFEQAYTAFRRVDERHGAVFALGCQAATSALLGDSDKAAERYAELSRLAPGECWLHSYVAWAMGLDRWRAGDLDAAARLEQDSIEMRRPFRDHLGLGMCLEVLAWITADRARPDAAAQLLGRASRALEREAPSITTGGVLADDHARCVARLCIQMGDEAFEDALGRGRKLDIDAAIALAGGPPRAKPRSVDEISS